MTTRISSSELSQFLDDVERNVDDESADFKKLTLYLFTFLNERLLTDEEDIVIRLFNILELVLSRKLHLLNVQLEYKDYESIYVPDLEQPLLYEWSISFALSHLASSKAEISNKLKSFIIYIINLVCTKLHNFKFIKLLRKSLLDILDKNLNHCFKQENIHNELVLATHLFSIVNDFDISQTLLINSQSYQLKLTSFARKLWYIVTDTTYHDLKSILLLNQTNNLMCNEVVTWEQICLLLSWIMEYLNSNVPDETVNSTISLSLLKVYCLCWEKGVLENFYNYMNFQSLLSKDIPKVISKSLHIIKYHHHLNENNTDIINMYQTSSLNEEIATSFEDPILESLRLKITTLDNNNYLKHFDWLNYIKKLTTDDLKYHYLNPDYTMYSLITALGHFPCVLNNDYNYVLKECTKCGNGPLTKNYYDVIDPNRSSVTEGEISKFYKDIILKYFIRNNVNRLEKNALLCTNFLILVFNLFASYSPPQEQDQLFSFLIQQLTHINRDVRMLITRIFPLYLIKANKDDECFKVILTKISSIDLTSSHNRHLGESSIKALVELSIISSDDWLFNLLVKLISLFALPNDQHVNYVYNGIISIASAKKLTPQKLLAPYIPSISDTVVINSAIFTKIIELSGVSKSYFLSRHKEHSIPRLLEYYKYDFIEEIANAANLTKWELISKNKSRIIAYYLTKGANEKYIMNVLTNVCPKFKILKLPELMSKIGDITWYVLLNIQSEGETITNVAQINSALKYIAKIAMQQRRVALDGGIKHIEYLLSEYILELVQKFHENVHHIRGTKPYLEKKCSLQAIEYIITTSISAVATALGQISTCLQATLENDSEEFKYLALRCWNELVKRLPSSQLISLIDIIISLIFQKFKTFSDRSRKLSIAILTKIYHEIKDSYKSYTLYYLSLPFQDYDFTPLIQFKKKSLSILDILSEFTRRLETSNEYVVKQALFDLTNYIEKYQHICQSEYFKDVTLTSAITKLIQTILDTSYKFKKVSSECAKVLGIIGALDSNKFNFKRIKQSLVIIHDFNDYQENTDFLIDFIETKIVKMFWSSNDPSKQLFSAYAMQKFLQVMKLTPKILEQDLPEIGTWDRFSDIAKSTLTPLLNSKYVAPNTKYTPIQFPYFKLGMKYETWLVDITLNLLNRPTEGDSDKSVIFQTCSMLVRDQDIEICQYVLKYIALSHIINNTAIEDLKKEFLHLLNVDINGGSPDRIESLRLCCQAMFSVLDYFGEWVSQTTQYLTFTAGDLTLLKRQLTLVNKFLESIPMDLIAIKSAQCDSYERTILYLEKCYREEKDLGDLNIATTLQSMYSQINDYDALNGVLKKFSTSNLQEKLNTFQYSDNWSLAHESFKVLDDTTKLLESLHDHGLYDDVLLTLSSRTNSQDLTSIPLDWALVGLCSAAYSGNFEQLEKWLQISDSIGNAQDTESIINYELSKALSFLHRKNESEFNKSVDHIYSFVGNSLVPSTSSSFNRNIGLMNQLHALYDLTLIVAGEEESKLKSRLDNVDQDFDVQYKILTLHNVGNKVFDSNTKVSDNLLYMSQLARKNNRLDISTRTIIQAMRFEQGSANIEYANLLWSQGNQAEAIKLLSEIIKSGNMSASTQLQYANWLDESNHLSTSEIIHEYNQAITLNSLWETSYYDLGKYYNKIMESSKDATGYYEQQIIRHFIKSLSVGNSFVFEALPKLVTIWLDFASKSRSSEAQRKLNQIVEDIKKATETVPNYTWYTAITQILSRITHDHTESYERLAVIVGNIIKDYPRQSLWYVLSHAKSSDSKRKSRIESILQKVTLAKSELGVTIQDANELFSGLIKLAQFKISKSVRTRKMSLSRDFKISYLNDTYQGLVIPVGSNLEIRLPNENTKRFTAFPKANTVTFNGCEDLVNIFHSLQMPRQITIRGSDSNSYKLMVKSDDTRKDAKVVEFTTMVNRILLSSNEARKRRLSIPNYCVIPLAENIGVIEFVNDVQTIKAVYHEQMKRMGKHLQERKVFMKIDEAQRLVKASKRSSDTSNKAMHDLVSTFTHIVKDHPPVLHNWFIENFTDPTSWYISRNSFTRSTAVMSMVGYIIGLGDRHCENILLFKKTGAVLHIDFDCLFEKGKTLPCPELVPFRLTQNVIDAMGICGIEGNFRISCEVTAKLLRQHEPPLMNILETLLYDPLLDWKNGQKPGIHLSKVRRKIRGLTGNDGLPMNIHGQVDVLIQEATSLETLAQMYAGWSAYV
ncbi:cell cycle checkpoint protein [Spathaspora passalidarum NRRL Y-27907]|uniref:Serine/threonine-protein kinase MEC1 n=1 Tax=Spathaspora passalidarum (strain NRRL Y-27907 / 11-Y1) TaxID=619300 RepID=G3APL0_SPAPN|nr:cell cycle checkpoint protein [Spathaspora passalidarum NRRL Y-27907]EGW32181.1 cell cycle checkpoint protein [Spathaspora passalidarum NRRL Y-27907]